ncbi:40248_t:CDS:1, partial [Gigaspora margarita]
INQVVSSSKNDGDSIQHILEHINRIIDQYISHYDNNQVVQVLLNPIKTTLNSTTNQIDYLLKCIQSDERTPIHYLALKTLLEDSSNSLSMVHYVK